MWLLCLFGVATTASARGPAAANGHPKVLVLLSYHPGFAWEDRILDGLTEWGDASSRPLFHVEWLDAKRYPGAAQRERMVRYLGEKYAGQHFDLIATVDDDALALVV